MSSRSTSSAAGPSLAGRFAAAIALTVGFYLLAIGLALSLVAFAIVPWITPMAQNLWLTIGSFILAGSIFAAIVPQRVPFHEPGLKISAADQPELMELVAAEARAAGEPMPDAVYLTLEANAAVTQAARDHRVLIIGVPLLHILSERQLRGVLAHEFGHYSGGDTRVGSWIFRTRATIIRTVQHFDRDETQDEGLWSMSQQAVQQPFIWYAKAFLRITARISRQQEFAADRRAVASAGRDAYAGALEQVHAYGPAFDSYWDTEVAPLLERRHRPPVSEGFRRFIDHENVTRVAGDYLDQLRGAETDPYDSHPSLPERLAAIEPLPAGEPDESPCSIERLRDPAGVERDLMRFAFGAQIEMLTPIEWDDVGRVVYGWAARELTSEFPHLLEGVTIGTLPEAVANRAQLAARIVDPAIHDRERLVLVALADGVLLALEAAGWSIVADVAEPVGARRDGMTLHPHTVIGHLLEGKLSAEQWREETSAQGIADLPLSVTERATATA